MMSLILLSIAALINAYPQPHGHSGLRKATRDADTSELFTSGVELCTGANLTDYCYTNPTPAGTCWTWFYTFMWIDSILADPGLTCYLYSGPLCNGVDTQLVPQVGGIADFSAIGWLDNMESFECFNASDLPVSDVGVSKVANTGAADVIPATADWPLFGIPLNDGSVSKLTVNGAVYANTTNANATHANHTISMRENSNTACDVYTCAGPDWTVQCECNDFEAGVCHSMADWGFRTVSIGPIAGIICHIYDDFACQSDHTISVLWPGLPDIQLNGFPYQVNSWWCENYVAAPWNPNNTEERAADAEQGTTHDMAVANAHDSGLSSLNKPVLPTGSIEERGNPGGCYICAQPNWGGECEYVLPMMGTCYSMENWDFEAISYGPDEQATCYISSDFTCGGSDDHSMSVVYPGLPNVQHEGFPYPLYSFQCTFQYVPSSAGDMEMEKTVELGVKVNETKAQEDCCTATVALTAPTGHVARPGGPLPTGNLTRPGAHLPK